MAVRTWVGRFCVAEGRVQEEGPWLGSLIRQRPDDDPDELYILVEPSSPGSVQYTSQLVDVIAQLYGKDPLSLTGALTRSLRAAHEHLSDWNRKSLKEHRVGAGASCLALRGTEAYLAQTGPGIAYVRSAGGAFRRIEADDASFEGSLGVAEHFTPHLRRIQLEPGDLVLLASTKLDAVAPPEHIERILSGSPDEALPELYMLCRDEADSALVLLSCFEEPEPLPEFLSKDAPTVAPVADDPSAAPPEPALVGAGATPPPLQAENALAFEGASIAPPRPIRDHVRDLAASNAPPRAHAGVRIRGGGATPRRKSAGGGNDVMRRIRLPVPMLLAAAAVVIAALLIWWQLPDSVAESREERFIALIAEAREANARAQATDQPALRRQLLTDAQSKLADAEKIHDDNGELLALQADVTAAIGVLDAVYEVREFTPLSDIAQQVTGSLSITQTVIGGGNAYLLDTREARVLRIPLDGSAAPETVLQDGDTNFVTPSRPVGIAWSPEANALIIIDDKRQAYSYEPGRVAAPLVVRGAEEGAGIDSVDGIAASNGNLYVLDVAGDQIWRYLPGQSGFDSERAGLLDGIVLADATELAVAQDLYVLDRKLGIRRLDGRSEIPFPLAGIDRPLMEPASLSVLPGSGRLVVADRGNKRIVVASAEGAFLRQIVSPAFTDLRAVAIDEGTSTLYVLNGDTLLQAPFPP
jgi:hypothetical protein